MTRGAGDASCSSDLCVWQPLAPMGVLSFLAVHGDVGSTATSAASLGRKLASQQRAEASPAPAPVRAEGSDEAQTAAACPVDGGDEGRRRPSLPLLGVVDGLGHSRAFVVA